MLRELGQNSSPREAVANNDFIKQRIWCLNAIRCPIHYKIYTCLPTFLVFLSIHELIICKLENHTTHQTANLSLMSVHRTKTTLLCFQCGLPDPPEAEPFLFHACPFISSTDCELSTCFLFIESRNFLSHIISWLQVSSFSSKFWSTSHPIQVHSLSVSR